MTSITARATAAAASVLITLTLAHQVALLAQPAPEAGRGVDQARLLRGAAPTFAHRAAPQAPALVQLAAARTTLR